MEEKRTTRSTKGGGTIRRKTIEKTDKKGNKRSYDYWEGRVTVGYHPGTGRQIQKTVTGKTKAVVAKKMRELAVQVDQATYQEPSNYTVGEWMDMWAATYLTAVKPGTVTSYLGVIRNYIKPILGAVKLDTLSNLQVQTFVNTIKESGLSAKSVKNCHGVLHAALERAARNKFIRSNPADDCVLPAIDRKKIHPLEKNESKAFLETIEGHPLEFLFATDLFTGLREGEIMGLKWSCVNFEAGTITVEEQLRYNRQKKAYEFLRPKNGKSRTIKVAPHVMQLLKRQKVYQAQQKLAAGPMWQSSDLVFTDDIGHHLREYNVYRQFKATVKQIGRPDARFHDLRHTYAAMSLMAGDDIKTLQENLGHATPEFTLSVYGHVIEAMRDASSQRMEAFIQNLLAS